MIHFTMLLNRENRTLFEELSIPIVGGFMDFRVCCGALRDSRLLGTSVVVDVARNT